jgi:peptide/nickel transport system substrate-binding protein
MKRFTRLLILSLVVVLTLSLGMGPLAAQDEVVIVLGWEQEPTQLPPLTVMAFGWLLTDFYLLDVWNWRGDDQEIFPIMVEEIPSVENGMVTTTDDGKTQVTYKLNEGMLWSDGEPITSADCAFGHLLYSDVGTGDFQRATYPEVVESFEVVDDYTFVMTYTGPFPDYTSDSTAVCQFAEHVFMPYIERDGNINNATPLLTGEGMVGYGPYVLDRWDVGEGFTFTRNPNWGVNDFEHVPAVDVVVTRTILDAAQMRSALAVGDIDMAFNFSTDLIDAYREIDGVEVWSTPGAFQDAVWINMNPDGSQHPALKDVNVRRAIAHALDREEMVEALIGPGLFVPPNYYHPRWLPDGIEPIPYDLAEAERLLDEAGWVDTTGDGIRDNGEGLSLTLRFYTTDAQIRKDYQLLVQSYLAEVGINVQPIPVPASILFAGFAERGILSSGDFDLAMFALSYTGLHPNVSPTWFSCDQILVPGGSNGWGFCSPRWDELHIDLIPFETDPVLRMEYIHEAVRLMDEAVFWVGAFPRTQQYALDTTRWNIETFYEMGTLSSNWLNSVQYWEPLDM